jgi:hypothetical protein
LFNKKPVNSPTQFLILLTNLNWATVSLIFFDTIFNWTLQLEILLSGMLLGTGWYRVGVESAGLIYRDENNLTIHYATVEDLTDETSKVYDHFRYPINGK